jgi:hypothetical protein
MSFGARFSQSQFGSVGSGNSFPDPFQDMATLAMPTTMRSALYWCLPPETLIELADLSLKRIDQIVPGDKVLTRGGSVERVKEIGCRSVTEPLTHIRCVGLPSDCPLSLTGNHKVWRLATPKLKPGRVAAKLNWSDAVQVRADQVTVGDYIASPVPNIPAVRAGTHPPDFPADSPRYPGWLLGMYVAEGCPIRDAGGKLIGVRFTLGKGDESSGVLSRLVSVLESVLAKKVTAYTPPSRSDIRLVSVHDVELPDWLIEHGGVGAVTKTLHSAVASYGAEFIADLLAGLIDGDGCVVTIATKYLGAQFQTSSRALAYQVQRLSSLIGLCPAVSPKTNAESTFGGIMAYSARYGKNDAHVIGCRSTKLQLVADHDDYAPTKARRSGAFVRDGYVYRRVTSVDQISYSGKVYNLEVENDHSYLANGLIVANCEYIFGLFGTYRMAMERVISYFLTDVDLLDTSDDEEDKWESFLNETLNIKTVMQSGLRDRACYGNAFFSVVRPFIRFLSCPKCGYMAPLREIHKNRAFAFKYTCVEPEKAFCATCPACKVGKGYSGPWRIDDKDDDNEKKLKIKLWNPHEMQILHDTFTEDTAYLWQIPEDYKRQLRHSPDGRGNLFALERAPKEVLRTVARNQLYRFDPGAIFHMKEPTLSGIYNRGWGLPRILWNFRQIWYVQVLRRFNEAIALDYVIPFRIITPAPAQGRVGGSLLPTDSLHLQNGSDFRGQITSMIKRRKRDPAAMQVLPFPVNFQMFGADANQLAPRDLLDQGTEQLLNDAGTPIELYNGSLQLQTAPVALRLFESTWHHLVHDSNSMLTWLVGQVSQIMSWETITARLKRVTVADNLEKQMLAAQLMMSQQISASTILGDLGYRWKKEQANIADEAKYQAELQMRTQEEMDQSGFAQQIAKGQAAGGQGGPGGAPAGAPAGGGQPAPGGQGGEGGQPGMMPGAEGPVTAYLSQMSPNVPQTPEDMMQVAQSLAQELLGLPESAKNRELRKLKQYNSALHTMVTKKLEEIRKQTRDAAGDAAMGQVQQGGGAPM